MQEENQIKEIFKKFTNHKKNLLPLLLEIQNKVGYISKEVMLDVSHFFNIHPSDVYSIVSFYDKFRRIPQGKYPITICLGTACHLAGGEMILQTFERELNIKVGSITEDRLFGLETASCFGCCTQAPVVKIKDKIYPKMNCLKVEEILVNLKNEISSNKRTE